MTLKSKAGPKAELDEETLETAKKDVQNAGKIVEEAG